MSETDKTAIEIVRNLQSNIRNTTIAMAGILLIALFGAIFWGGVINNQVNNNEENIDKLTETVNAYIKESRVARGSYLKESELIPFQQAWNEMALNWGHISYWAEAQGYKPLSRSQADALLKTKIN